LKGYFIQSGSVTGSNHNLVGKPNQDFGFLINRDDLAIGFVSDGCGSSANSQFGSILLSKMVENSFNQFIFDFGVEAITRENLGSIFQSLEKNTLDQLSVFAEKLKMTDYNVGKDYLLCTMMGFILTKEFLTVFHYGDGYYRFDGEVITTNIIQFHKNAPDYLAYKLYPRELPDQQSRSIRFQSYSLNNFKSLIISTDGIEDLPNPHIHELLNDDLYIKNPKAVQRFLQKRNKEERIVDFDKREFKITPPFLKDDTTLILVRKI
jgi:serine/threonine protein phosphatase PrpC